MSTYIRIRQVAKAEYLFSLPNIYIYSGFPVHTLDMFFRCTVEDTLHFEAMDDAADLFFLPLKDIRTEEFGLGSIRKGVGIFLEDIRKNKSEWLFVPIMVYILKKPNKCNISGLKPVFL